MEALLKRELATSVLKSTGHSGGGCISEGQSFDTDTGRVFVKINHKTEVRAHTCTSTRRTRLWICIIILQCYFICVFVIKFGIIA